MYINCLFEAKTAKKELFSQPWYASIQTNIQFIPIFFSAIICLI